MKRVGVREFRDHATRYLGGEETLVVERHGQPVGFYIPTGTTPQESFAQALDRLQHTVERIKQESGLSEEELSRLYDVRELLPEQPKRQRSGRHVPETVQRSDSDAP